MEGNDIKDDEVIQPLTIDGKYVMKIIEEDTKLNKQLTTNILATLDIGNSISISHPEKKEEMLSLKRFITVCKEQLRYGYATEVANEALRAYNVILETFESSVIPRTKEALRKNVTIAIKRKQLINGIYTELEQKRTECDRLWKVNNVLINEVQKMDESLKNMGEFVEKFRTTDFVKNWEKSFRSSMNEALNFFLITVDRDLKSLAQHYGVEKSVKKISESIQTVKEISEDKGKIVDNVTMPEIAERTSGEVEEPPALPEGTVEPPESSLQETETEEEGTQPETLY